MAKLTVVFGVLLAGVALAGHWMIGGGLHAFWFGVVLVVCGALAMTEDAKRRMIFMHVAVLVGLLGFLIPGSMATVSMVKGLSGRMTPALVHEQILIAGICLVYVVLCVRSFVAARRGRAA